MLGKRGLLENGSFQKSPFSRDSREFRDSRDCGKQRRFRPFSRDSREFRGRKTGLRFAGFVFLTFPGPLASHDSNPYSNRSRITRCNATNVSTICYENASQLPPCRNQMEEKWMGKQLFHGEKGKNC